MSKRIRIDTSRKLDDAAVAERLAREEAQNLAWEARIAQQRREWKMQDQAKFYNPDRDPNADSIWNVYAWVTLTTKEVQKENRRQQKANRYTNIDAAEWRFMGQRDKHPLRKKPMTMNRLFAGIRQALGVPADHPVLLISEQDDNARKKRGDTLPPPKYHDTLRPWTPPKEAMEIKLTARSKPTRIRKDTSPKLKLEPVTKSGFTIKTKFVAFAPPRKGQVQRLYLGPCEAETQRKAYHETRARFTHVAEPYIVAVRNLSYNVRSRLKTATAGSTKFFV